MNISKIIVRPLTCLILSVVLLACDTSSSPSPAADETTTQENNSASQANAVTQPAQVAETIRYTTLETPLSVSTGEKIEVTELFWYGCSHCFALEPFINTWLETKPETAEFIKIPAVFSASWGFHAQAFYTMEALGVLEQASDPFFHQIHVTRRPINSLDSFVEFMADFDKDEQEVTAAFNSFAVDSKLRNATNITKQSTATGVPAILVDGKYLTSVSQAGGQAELFELVDELVDKAANER